MNFQYLHVHAAPHGVGIYSLDHRLLPEVRAMLCAMSSRMPTGGIRQRYGEVIDAVARPLCVHLRWDDLVVSEDATAVAFLAELRRISENQLTRYPLPESTQKFLDTFVGQYGHSSILELTGEPTIFVEGVSWYTAWLSFDGPLVKGQEFSTRAKAVANWPLCAEVYEEQLFWQAQQDQRVTVDDAHVPTLELGDLRVQTEGVHVPHVGLQALHRDWLAVFEAELAWWTEHLQSAENREALDISDNEPFRPAYDRARWALPGTIATGCAHTANVRDMGRVLSDGLALARNSLGGQAAPVWEALIAAYNASLPGLAPYSRRTALTTAEQDKAAYAKVPGHLVLQRFDDIDEILQWTTESGAFAKLSAGEWDGVHDESVAYVRGKSPGYIDPSFNRTRVMVGMQCSLAVARDWHRHRTVYPWTLRPLLNGGGAVLHRAYTPRSELGISATPDLLRRSGETFAMMTQDGETYNAILALPLGANALLYGFGGLRDVVYMLELRSRAHGTNFEYREQALTMLKQLDGQVRLEDL